MLAQEKITTGNQPAAYYEDLLNLKHLLGFSTKQFESLSIRDKGLAALSNQLTALCMNNFEQAELELNKLKRGIPVKWNIIHGFKKKECSYENYLQLEALIINSYKTLINNTAVNFSLRKKLQDQLNHLLYSFLQVKLLRSNPSMVPQRPNAVLF